MGPLRKDSVCAGPAPHHGWLPHGRTVQHSGLALLEWPQGATLGVHAHSLAEPGLSRGAAPAEAISLNKHAGFALCKQQPLPHHK